MAQAYRSIYGSFWTGKTGRQIRAAGPAAQVLAFYVITSPHANMVGLYYLPLSYIQNDTGLSADEVRESLDALTRLGFVVYDLDAEWIWVCSAVHYQVTETAAKQVAGARTLYHQATASPSLRLAFWERYRDRLQLGDRPGAAAAAPSPMGLDTVATPSPDGQETVTTPPPTGQETVRIPIPEGIQTHGRSETETETETEIKTGTRAPRGPAGPPAVPPAQPIARLLWEHHRRFHARYDANPGPYTGQHARLAKAALGVQPLDRLVDLLDEFFADRDPFFAQTGHQFAAFVKCLDKLVALSHRPRAAPPPEAWAAVLARVGTTLNRLTLRDWFGPLRCLRDDGDRLVVQGPENHVRWVQKHYADALASALQDVRPGLRIDWHVEEAAA